MSDELARRPDARLAKPLARELVEEAARNARRSLSDATKRAYATSWTRFEGWCQAHGLPALPADEPTIVTYLTAAAAGYELEGVPVPPLGYASLERLYAALRVQHAEADLPLGTLVSVRNTMKALGRKLGVAPKNQKRAFTVEQVAAAVRLLGDSPADLRARAVLLFGWIIGQRRSDIADLRVDDVVIDEEGATVTIRKSKTDQLGEGRTVAVTRRGGRFCAVGALEAWLALKRDDDDDSLLGVSAITVNTIVKRAAASLGLDAREYGGHSLRRGFVTSAARSGKDVAAIMAVTGHESVKQVMGYIEKATPFKRDIGSALFSELADAGDETEMPKKPLREYIPPVQDKTLKATIGELAGPLLTKAPLVENGQPLVDLKAAREMKRRTITRPDFTRHNAPCDVAWLVSQSLRMEEKGRSVIAIVAAFNAINVRHGDGSAITGEDVKRWLV